MLIQLSVKNFAIVKSLDIEFKQGMTAITGETGAGKSIAIDALGLCLGERAEGNSVRKGAKKAEITACFNVKHNRRCQQWLAEHDLEDVEDTCILRRVISSEGRSKAYINGSPVPLQQLKELGPKLVAIHGQHAHQALLKPDAQRALLDSDESIQKQLTELKALVTRHNQAQKELDQLQQMKQRNEDRKNLLSYQLTELDEFGLLDNEFDSLESEFRKMSHSQSLLEDSQISYHELCESEQGNAATIISRCLERITDLVEHDDSLKPVQLMLREAQINIDEAGVELANYVDCLEIDPLKMQQTELRYSRAIELARKHLVQPENLVQHHLELKQEYQSLFDSDHKSESLEAELQAIKAQYQTLADKLHSTRCKVAKRLQKSVALEIKKMNMPDAEFEIAITDCHRDKINSKGHDQVEFLLCSNKGMNLEKLEKAASGGELSRIGLALQVLGNKTHAVPTLIFDEVDTGISGGTASVVGDLLKTLGENETQVFCVTHLPQVAAKAQNQMLVTKFSDGKTTETHMTPLDEDKRIEELARLLAGDTLTESAIANAKALLQQ
ncbi:DNA repair protein RecN [Planctobacterium marinum]